MPASHIDGRLYAAVLDALRYAELAGTPNRIRAPLFRNVLVACRFAPSEDLHRQLLALRQLSMKLVEYDATNDEFTLFTEHLAYYAGSGTVKLPAKTDVELGHVRAWEQVNPHQAFSPLCLQGPPTADLPSMPTQKETKPDNGSIHLDPIRRALATHLAAEALETPIPSSKRKELVIAAVGDDHRKECLRQMIDRGLLHVTADGASRVTTKGKEFMDGVRPIDTPKIRSIMQPADPIALKPVDPPRTPGVVMTANAETVSSVPAAQTPRKVVRSPGSYAVAYNAIRLLLSILADEYHFPVTDRTTTRLLYVALQHAFPNSSALGPHSSKMQELGYLRLLGSPAQYIFVYQVLDVIPQGTSPAVKEMTAEQAKRHLNDFFCGNPPQKLIDQLTSRRLPPIEEGSKPPAPIAKPTPPPPAPVDDTLPQELREWIDRTPRGASPFRSPTACAWKSSMGLDCPATSRRSASWLDMARVQHQTSPRTRAPSRRPNTN